MHYFITLLDHHHSPLWHRVRRLSLQLLSGDRLQDHMQWQYNLFCRFHSRQYLWISTQSLCLDITILPEQHLVRQYLIQLRITTRQGGIGRQETRNMHRLQYAKIVQSDRHCRRISQISNLQSQSMWLFPRGPVQWYHYFDSDSFILLDSTSNVMQLNAASSLTTPYFKGNQFKRASNYLLTQWLDVEDPLLINWLTPPTTNNKMLFVASISDIPAGNYTIVINNHYVTNSSKKLLLKTVNSLGADNYTLGFSLLFACKMMVNIAVVMFLFTIWMCFRKKSSDDIWYVINFSYHFFLIINDYSISISSSGWSSINRLNYLLRTRIVVLLTVQD